ncbi:MAG: polysaccharide pyruvyl transferase family protein [Elusimicrobiota bacterium]|jgi:hypothetical protein|nr:polysaccharide pyruvyl transferase family protein [Elusimicrobiota bacterium]
MALLQKIHFIHRPDDTNVGDMKCCSLEYFYDFFNNYNIIKHDIASIKWSEISRYDIIILGGGGILYNSDLLQENINRLLQINPNVIGWGIGFNTHKEQRINIEIDFSKFKLIGIRDFNHPCKLEYLPCVSCLDPAFKLQKQIKRRVGVIEHLWFKINEDFGCEKISNWSNFDDLIDFISETEVIVTSSYHIVFWSILMKKKVICINPFSNKFDFFKYKPAFYSGNLESDIQKAAIYDGALQDGINFNEQFFQRVKAIVEANVANGKNQYQKLFYIDQQAIQNRRIEFLNNKIDELMREHNRTIYPKWLIKFLSRFIFNKKSREIFRAKWTKKDIYWQ